MERVKGKARDGRSKSGILLLRQQDVVGCTVGGISLRRGRLN